MIKLLFQKIKKSKWLTLCLLIGLIFSSAIVSSIPIYSRGILNRIIKSDFVDYQTKNHVYPGSYSALRKVSDTEQSNRLTLFSQLDGSVSKLAKQVDLPVLSHNTTLTVGNLNPYNETQSSWRANCNISLSADLDKHVKMTAGKMYSKTVNSDGSYDVIVSEQAANEMCVDVGSVCNLIDDYKSGTKPFKVKVVGIFSPKSSTDSYWYGGLLDDNKQFFMNPDLMKSSFLKNETVRVVSMRWYYAYDVNSLKLQNINNLISTFDDQSVTYHKSLSMENTVSMTSLLKSYTVKTSQLSTTLWVLLMPMLLMFVFYIFMISNLLVDKDKSEISLAKSRGASNRQVFKIYLIQGGFLGAIAVVLGPPLGLFFSSVLGASNGFLSFVDRKALELSITYTEFIYSFLVVLVFIVTMMIPVIIASRASVVQVKQAKNDRSKKPVWQKFYLDLILLAIAIYGIYLYSSKPSYLTALSAKDAPIDPLMYIMSTVFILSIGLVFLRIFPYLVKLIFWIGKKKWTPSAYASMINVSRSKTNNQFIMLFLILTISVGIFDLKAARTINLTFENNIKYTVGTDLILKEHWSNNAMEAGKKPYDPYSNNAKGLDAIDWYEPDFNQIKNLNGVKDLTKVFVNENKFSSLTCGDTSIYATKIMGIIPSEFGKVAWFDPSLLPVHWNNYLNLLTKNPNVMLVSNNFKTNYGLKVGDRVKISYCDSYSITLPIDGVIGGFVDYWPSIKLDSKYTYFVICNLTYLQKQGGIAPYEVWIKKSDSPNANSLIYNNIKKDNLVLEEFQDSTPLLINQKNDPMFQGTNGTLTLSFIATMFITAVGFALYWILSIKERILQFGILRAMGLSLKNILGMLGIEQLLISGTAIVVGIITGNATSNIFIPFLKYMGNTQSQYLPFRPTAYTSDYINLAVILGSMLIVVFIILARFLSKLNINQAIKLGED